jgi:hypothetical protein
MPVKGASSEETPDDWFVPNLVDALAVRNEEKAARRTRSKRGDRMRHAIAAFGRLMPGQILVLEPDELE